MLDIGWSEMTVVLIILLVVVGPSELPRLLKGFRSFTSSLQRVRSEIRGHVDEMVREADLESALENEKQMVGDALGVKGSSMKDVVADHLSPITEIAKEVKDIQKDMKQSVNLEESEHLDKKEV